MADAFASHVAGLNARWHAGIPVRAALSGLLGTSAGAGTSRRRRERACLRNRGAAAARLPPPGNPLGNDRPPRLGFPPYDGGRFHRRWAEVEPRAAGQGGGLTAAGGLEQS